VAGHAFLLQEHSRLQHPQIVEGRSEQFAEIGAVEGEKHVGPGKRTEQDRAILPSLEDSQPIKW
jgi:hypothetical protein